MTAGSYYNLITFNGQHPYMLKEAAKRSFRFLLQRVLSIHIGNKCITSPIVMENILANSTGILQFSEEETTALTSEGVNRNYADLESCMVCKLKEIYGDAVRRKLPKGFSHLLDGWWMTVWTTKHIFYRTMHCSCQLLPAQSRFLRFICFCLKSYRRLIRRMLQLHHQY
jgi:hypothetical protein